jgi:hypothetical protein
VQKDPRTRFRAACRGRDNLGFKYPGPEQEYLGGAGGAVCAGLGCGPTAAAAREREVREWQDHPEAPGAARSGELFNLFLQTGTPSHEHEHYLQRKMSTRRAGKAGSWYTSNAAQLDAQLTEWASLPALVPPGAALRDCAHHLLHLYMLRHRKCAATARACDRGPRAAARRTGQSFHRSTVYAGAITPVHWVRRACQRRAATGAQSAQDKLEM